MSLMPNRPTPSPANWKGQERKPTRSDYRMLAANLLRILDRVVEDVGGAPLIVEDRALIETARETLEGDPL